MSTTYRRIGAVELTCRILDHLANQREPVAGPEVARAVEAPAGTVMCHLATLEDHRVVRQVGGGWELGMALAAYWARKKSLLEGAKMQIERDLETLVIAGGT